jgi:hypothetical protein
VLAEKLPLQFAEKDVDWSCSGVLVLWLTRNDDVFQRTTPKSFLQVVFRAAHWIRS